MIYYFFYLFAVDLSRNVAWDRNKHENTPTPINKTPKKLIKTKNNFKYNINENKRQLALQNRNCK